MGGGGGDEEGWDYLYGGVWTTSASCVAYIQGQRVDTRDDGVWEIPISI